MKKHIAEELPARKHAPAAAGAAAGDKKEAGGKSPEKRVKQAIYDIRYRARREELPIRQAYSQYMQNSSMSQQEKTMVKAKLFGKGGVQAEDFNIEEFASSNVANALYKVFVEGVQKEEEPIVLTYMEKLETAEHRKYKVKVTDKSGRSYVRYATREKISSLRSNPNIQSVEMTGYGEPYEGEKKKGEQTARAKAGKGLDPVGKEDSDPDNDGKHNDPNDKYIMKRRAAIGKAIASRGTQKEEFLGEVNDEAVNPDANEKEIDVMKGKNTVKINPEVPGTGKNSSSYMQVAHYDMLGNPLSESEIALNRMLQEKKMGKEAKQKEKRLKAKYDPSGMKASMIKQYGEKKGKQVYFAKIRGEAMREETVAQAYKKAKKEQDEMDPRSIPTAMNLAKNKLRAMGLKCSHELEGKVLGENEDKERKGTDYKGRDYGPGPKPTVKIPFEGVMQGGWLKKQQAKSKDTNKTA
jgi:hypothetical protein